MRDFRYFPRPKYGPARDYTYLTDEPYITRTQLAMGLNPQPWQRYVWAVGTEHRIINGVKVYRYSDVMVTIPRQGGKSTLLHPLRLYKMIDNDQANLFSTAQTGHHSSLRMLDMVDKVDQSPIGSYFKPRRGKGDAGLISIGNGSTIKQFTPNSEALHGETPLCVDCDEIWH